MSSISEMKARRLELEGQLPALEEMRRENEREQHRLEQTLFVERKGLFGTKVVKADPGREYLVKQAQLLAVAHEIVNRQSAIVNEIVELQGMIHVAEIRIAQKGGR